MSKPKLIQKMIQKHNERQNNKPRYKIEDLYCGQIVHFLDKEYVGQSFPYRNLFEYVLGRTNRYTYVTIKEFAIFTKKDTYGPDTYIHLKSGQALQKMRHSIKGDYAIEKPVLFKEIFPLEMRKYGLTEKSKFSKAEICELEDELNKEYSTIQQTDNYIEV